MHSVKGISVYHYVYYVYTIGRNPSGGFGSCSLFRMTSFYCAPQQWSYIRVWLHCLYILMFSLKDWKMRHISLQRHSWQCTVCHILILLMSVAYNSSIIFWLFNNSLRDPEILWGRIWQYPDTKTGLSSQRWCLLQTLRFWPCVGENRPQQTVSSKLHRPRCRRGMTVCSSDDELLMEEKQTIAMIVSLNRDYTVVLQEL